MGSSTLESACLILFGEMRVYIMCLSLNDIKCSERDPGTLKIPKHGQLSTAQELEAFVSLWTGN